MRKSSTTDKGKKAEDLASKYIMNLGYAIMERNWRFKRAEIDIIASKQNIMVFLEVKSRSGTMYGAPETGVTPHKELLLADAASAYMLEKSYTGEYRFDIISVLFRLEEKPVIEHFIDAFFPGI